MITLQNKFARLPKAVSGKNFTSNDNASNLQLQRLANYVNIEQKSLSGGIIQLHPIQFSFYIFSVIIFSNIHE